MAFQIKNNTAEVGVLNNIPTSVVLQLLSSEFYYHACVVGVGEDV